MKAQTFPHAPQFWGSFQGMHVPLQKIWPEGQAQAPDWHVLPPAQTFPQVPQLLGSFATVQWLLQTIAPVGQLPPPWQVKRPSGPS